MQKKTKDMFELQKYINFLDFNQLIDSELIHTPWAFITIFQQSHKSKTIYKKKEKEKTLVQILKSLTSMDNPKVTKTFHQQHNFTICLIKIKTSNRSLKL